MKLSEIDTQPATAVLNNITRSKTARIKEIVNGVVFGTWHSHPRNLILLSKCLYTAFPHAQSTAYVTRTSLPVASQERGLSLQAAGSLDMV